MTKGRILVSGSSGPIGTALLPRLAQGDYQVMRLVRAASGGIPWDPAQPLDPRLVSGFAGVIHLAGEPIVGRWTEAKKRRIYESRTAGTQNLANALAGAEERPRVLISASAIGFYGSRGDELLCENSASGQDFLSAVCRDWESSTGAALQAGIRTVHARFGLILSRHGGALPKMLTPFRLGLGGRVGNGRQWWSWIHIKDVVEAIVHALENASLQGPVNVVAPAPVRNSRFTKILAELVDRPAWFPIPGFAARLVFGQMADELLLASQRVEAAKLRDHGYRFAYSELPNALEALLRRR